MLSDHRHRGGRGKKEEEEEEEVEEDPDWLPEGEGVCVGGRGEGRGATPLWTLAGSEMERCSGTPVISEDSLSQDGLIR